MADEEDTGYFTFQSPWKNIFLWHFMEVESEAFIATPAIDMDILRKIQSILIARADRKLRIKILVRFSEEDFVSRGIEPETLRILALLREEPNSKIEIRFLPNLSLTSMILDRKKAILATGDLSTRGLIEEVNYGQLMMGEGVVEDFLGELKELWKESVEVRSNDIIDYMGKIKKRIDIRSEAQYETGDADRHFDPEDMISLGKAIEPLGRDRDEPHLDESRKIVKELLIRARDAVEMEKTEAALFYLEEGLSLDPDNLDLLLEKGKILYSEIGDYEAALQCLDKVLDRNDDSRDAWAYQGMCHHKLNDLDEALYAYDQATDIDQNFYPVWIKKGIILGKKKGREKDGIKCLEFALSQDPYNEEAWFNKAVILDQRLNKMEEAIMAYRSLLRINPKHVVGSFRMGLISYKRLDDPAKAKKYFDRVLEADPEHVHAWLFRGEIAEKVDGSFKKALEFYEKAREVKPDSPDVLHKEIKLLLKHKKKFSLAVKLADDLLVVRDKDPVALYVAGLGALKKENDPHKALDLMNQSIRADPTNKDTIVSKANILAEYLNRASDAVKLLKAALKREKEDPELWMELGLTYFDFLYDPKEAIGCFDMVTRLDKENADGWYNKGLVLSRGFEKHQDGLKCLDQATRLDDEHYLAWYEKGRILFTNYNMIDDSVKCYRKALSIEPEEGEVLAALAKAHRAQGDTKNAVDLYRKAISADPELLKPYMGLSEILMEMGRYDELHANLTDALQVDPKSERIWLMKAQAFRAQNELRKSLECYKRVLRINPDNQDALNSKTSVEAQLERASH